MFFSLHTCLFRVKIWNQIIEPKEGKKVTGLLGRFTSQSRTFFRSKTKMVESTKHLKSSCWPTIDHVAHHMGQSVKKKKKKRHKSLSAADTDTGFLSKLFRVSARHWAAVVFNMSHQGRTRRLLQELNLQTFLLQMLNRLQATFC